MKDKKASLILKKSFGKVSYEVSYEVSYVVSYEVS